MREKLKKWYNGCGGPKKYELVLAGILLFISAYFFCFRHDFYLTLNQSLTFDACLLNGKLMRFYTIVNHQALTGTFSPEWPSTLLASANYSIINYATFGIVCLPFYLLGKIAGITIPFLLYEAVIKTLYVVLDIYMAKIVYDICRLMKLDETASRWITFLFITSPILLFSSTMITHLDIFCVLFFLLGMRSLLKEKRKHMLIFFMLAAAYKPFIVLSIIPIILLKEKRFLYIIRDLIIMMLGILVQSGVYRFDPGYERSQKFMSKTYDFIGRFFACGFDYTRNFYKENVSIFIISFCLICLAAYMIKKKNQYYLFAFPLLVWGTFILFVQWHPNWLLLIVPFLVFAVAFTGYRKVMLLLQGFLAGFIILVSSVGWQGNYDNNIINGGVISQLFGMTSEPKYEIANILTNQLGSIPLAIYGSVLSAVMVCIMQVVVMDCLKPDVKNKDTIEWERGLIWFSICPIIAFILYSILACIL